MLLCFIDDNIMIKFVYSYKLDPKIDKLCVLSPNTKVIILDWIHLYFRRF